MSTDTTRPASSETITVKSAEETVVPTRNWVQRKVVDPIKSHPKIAAAVAGGVVLVTAAAFTGRKSAQYDVILELQPADLPEVEPITVIDTSSTDDE